MRFSNCQIYGSLILRLDLHSKTNNTFSLKCWKQYMASRRAAERNFEALYGPHRSQLPFVSSKVISKRIFLNCPIPRSHRLRQSSTEKKLLFYSFIERNLTYNFLFVLSSYENFQWKKITRLTLLQRAAEPNLGRSR